MIRNAQFHCRAAMSAAVLAAGLLMGGAASASTLSVDFSASDAGVQSGHAGFVMGNNTVPGTRSFSSGSTGYTGSMDTGGGVAVTVMAPDAANQVFRLVDRGSPDLLLRDFVGRDTSFNRPQRLVFSGLRADEYTLTLYLTDTSNQQGVVDTQLSVNGGADFSDVGDNVPYGLNLGRTADFTFTANGMDDVAVQFWVGGNQFGATGGTTDNIARNRIFTLNGFTLHAANVPEPTSWALMGAGLGVALAMTRRRRTD